MRFIIFFVFGIVCFVNALEVRVNFGREQGKDFSVLTLAHEQPFECKEVLNVYNEISQIECIIDEVPINNFIPTNTLLFSLSTKVVSSRLHLFIKPHKKARLFSTFLDLKKGQAIPKERPRHSRFWQVVAFEDVIPFLSNRKSSGLNFPIKIPSTKDIFLKQLDLNREPLVYKEGEDFNKLLAVRSLYAQGKYEEVLSITNQILKDFPNTIFRKDFLLNKILSLAQVAKREDSNTIITLALEWIKDYPSDKSAPDILYLLANTYAQTDGEKDAIYYFNQIITEYPNSDYSALAKMQLAYYYSDKDYPKISSALFAEAYKEVKTQQASNEVMTQWALYYLRKKETSKAQELIDVVFKEHPNYFLFKPQKTYEVAQLFAKYGLFADAGKIGAYLINHSQTSMPFREALLDQIGEWYSNAKMLHDAYRYNTLFLKTYPDSKEYQKVDLRNDELFFGVASAFPPLEQIQKYDTMIEKYKNTPLAQKALWHKAEALYGMGTYNEILQLGLQDENLIKKAKKALILQAIEAKNCKIIPDYLDSMDFSDFAQQDRLSLFDCLYSLSLYSRAYEIIQKEILKDTQVQTKLPWIYRDAKVLNKLGEYVKSKQSAQDTLELAKALEQKQYNDIIFVLFDDFSKLKMRPQAQKVGIHAENLFKDDIRMNSVYFTLLKWAQEANDANASETYAQDILRIQKLHNSTTYTPVVDLILADLLNKQERFQEALDVLEALKDTPIDPSDLQRILYLKGSLFKSLDKLDQSRQSFEQCAQMNQSQAWKNLCQKSLKLLK